jgi:hypothetical protein
MSIGQRFYDDRFFLWFKYRREIKDKRLVMSHKTSSQDIWFLIYLKQSYFMYDVISGSFRFNFL